MKRPNKLRDEEIISDRAKGRTLREIAQGENISRARVDQILKKDARDKSRKLREIKAEIRRCMLAPVNQLISELEFQMLPEEVREQKYRNKIYELEKTVETLKRDLALDRIRFPRVPRCPACECKFLFSE